MLKSMHSIRSKLYLSVIPAALLVAIALVTSLRGMESISDEFVALMDHDQMQLRHYNTMYTQGLQAGQALRNIVLDPGNPKGYENLNKAGEDFETALRSARQLAAHDQATMTLLDNIAADWKTNVEIKQQVLPLAKSDMAAAISMLNKQETPSWRKLRGQLKDMIGAQEKHSEEIKQSTVASATRIRNISAILGGVAILAGCVLVLLISETIVKSVQRLNKSLQTLASGDADLTQRLPVETQDEIGQASASFNRFIEGLQGLVVQINGNVQQVTQAANSLSAESQSLAGGSSKQAEATSAMAAAVEQMTVSVDHISDSANEAMNLSHQHGEIARDGSEVVHRATHQMHGIADSVQQSTEVIESLGRQSQQISAIINVIKEVADQTNLLALNAAIEAARAGEHGRGFSVVADEVRKLAERTTQATVEIGTMVTSIQADTKKVVQQMQGGADQVAAGVASATEAGNVITHIRDNTLLVDQAIQDISLSLKEQSQAARSIAENVERIAGMTEENNHSISVAANTAASLRDAASTLRGLVSRFRA